MGVSLLLAECQGGRGPTTRVTTKQGKKKARKRVTGLVGSSAPLGTEVIDSGPEVNSRRRC